MDKVKCAYADKKCPKECKHRLLHEPHIVTYVRHDCCDELASTCPEKGIKVYCK
jgi:hypothetical protein